MSLPPVYEPDFITVEPAEVTLYDDTFIQLITTGHYTDGPLAGETRVLTEVQIRYLSNDEDVATVTNTPGVWGRCYGVAPGTTTIHVTWIGGPSSISDSTALTVTPHPPYAAPESRFSIGFGPTLDPYPTWTAIDAHPNLVTSYSIDRGRSYELDQTDAGRATIQIQDPDGILDPTNPAGPYYGQIRPLLHAVLCRRNPVTGAWHERFRGFIEDYTYETHPSQRVNQLTITLTDAFDLAANAELEPIYSEEDGYQTVYGQQTSDQRIINILSDIGIPRRMWVVLPGNVILNPTTYSQGETALNAIQEAADGEFPAVTNVFCDRKGRLCFRGRNARFDPAGAAAAAGADAWDYHEWKAGDSAAVTASPTDTAQVRAFGYQRGLSKIINSATASPIGIKEQDVSSQRITDLNSVNAYGVRSWSASNLLTYSSLDFDGEGDGTGPLGQTKKFAVFYVANYANPRDRITQIAFRSLRPDDPRAAANWDLLTRIDIGDTVTVTVTAPGGGGFTSEPYFVEGVHEDARPAVPNYDDVTVTLDLSPRAYYNINPFAVDIPGVPEILEAPERHPVLRPGKPKPTPHAADHEHGKADPHRIHYEKVGTEAGEDGGTVDLTGYIHYDSVGGINTGDSLEVVTTDNGGMRFYAAAGSGGDIEIHSADGDFEGMGTGDILIIPGGYLRLAGIQAFDPLIPGAVWFDPSDRILRISAAS
jgi:hypothetical protein